MASQPPPKTPEKQTRDDATERVSLTRPPNSPLKQPPSQGLPRNIVTSIMQDVCTPLGEIVDGLDRAEQEMVVWAVQRYIIKICDDRNVAYPFVTDSTSTDDPDYTPPTAAEERRQERDDIRDFILDDALPSLAQEVRDLAAAPSQASQPAAAAGATPAAATPAAATTATPSTFKYEGSRSLSLVNRNVLVPIQYALSASCTAEDLTKLRDDFYAAVCNSTYDIGKQTHPYKPEEAKDITNWIFHRMLGPPGRNHVFDLCAQYARGDGIVDAGIAIRAENLAKTKGLPPSCRDFLTAYSRSKKSEASSETKHQKLLSMAAMVRVCAEYEALMRACQPEHARQKDIKAWLEANGYKFAQGTKVSAQLLKYLGDKLEVDGKKLTNYAQEAQTLRYCVSLWGSGCLVFITKDVMVKFKKMSHAKIKPVITAIHAGFPQVREIFELARQHIYDPMLQGKKLQVEFKKAKLPWTRLLRGGSPDDMDVDEEEPTTTSPEPAVAADPEDTEIEDTTEVEESEAEAEEAEAEEEAEEEVEVEAEAEAAK